MALEFAEVGRRSGKVSVSISKKTKLMSFSSEFFNKYLGKSRPKYIRQGYDKEKNQIGVQFSENDDDTGLLLKLSYTETGNAAACGISPVLNNFGLKIDSISGVYSKSAISITTQHTDTSGTFSDVFLLDVDKRKK